MFPELYAVQGMFESLVTGKIGASNQATMLDLVNKSEGCVSFFLQEIVVGVWCWLRAHH